MARKSLYVGNMVGDESVSKKQNYSSNTENDDVINVPFPYPASKFEEDPGTFTEPAMKIDYTSIGLPPPKKTITVRRNANQTRLVKLEKSLNKDLNSAETRAAESQSEKKNPDSPAPKNDEAADSMKKLLQAMGTLTLAAQETQRQYAVISTTLEKQSAALPKLDALQKHFDQSHKVETGNQRLFDVMHSELKGYKDNFLFDSLQKPVIRDMLALFDDLCGQARRVARFINENDADSHDKVSWKAELQASHDNINNTVFFIIEVLNRLDVTMLDSNDTVLDLKLHKVVGVEPTDLPEEKNRLARVVRPGFLWKERVLRPTEVIIKKYSPVEIERAN